MVVRCVGYSVSVLLVGLSVDHRVGRHPRGSSSSVALTVGTVAYVSRSDYAGGYVLIGLTAIAATFMCFVGILPFLSPF